MIGTYDTWYLYILRCSDATLYTGVTTNVERRLAMHQKGEASKYTRSRLPVRIVHHEACIDRADALRKEHRVKKMTKEQKETYIREPWTEKN